MKSSKQKHELLYFALFQHVKAIQRRARKEKRKSPTIAEIAASVGDSEEHILESMEFGQTSFFTQSYIQ